MQYSISSKRVFWILSGVALLFTVAWCAFLGASNLRAASLAFVVCSASFACGSLFGFLFTIFGDELEPFGKIRDAAIALASGITGLGIAKAKDIGSLIGSIPVLTDDPTRNPSFAILLVLTYVISGFYFMYLMRNLALNPALADAKRAMDRLHNSSNVSVIAARITEKLSPTVLLGREYVEEIEELESDDAKALRADIASEQVELFLKACEADATGDKSIQPENVALAARLHYYRVYFAKKGTDVRRTQEQRAIEWANRVLNRDPTNPEFRMKLADVFLLRGRYDEAAAIIERLEREDDSPQLIQQWLGYFLLFIEGREADSIKHSLAFHNRFPDESSGLFNAACGYAQLYEVELREANSKSLPHSANRLESLKYLREGIRSDSDLRALARSHSETGASFESLATDNDFLQLTANPEKTTVLTKT
jgi:tetratricopeptide (TPR) repeat protein